MTEEELARLRAEHGPIAIVKAQGLELAFKTPSGPTWEEFQDKVAAGSKVPRGAAFRELCHRCLVLPSREEAQAVFERLPALPAKISNTLADLAGAEAEIEVKKE